MADRTPDELKFMVMYSLFYFFKLIGPVQIQLNKFSRDK
jgi:hypothetical protein